MKKILSFILVLIMCLGVFAACTPNNQEPAAATLDDAKTYLAELYKDSNPKPDKDYDVVGKVIVNGVTFTVTWASNDEAITIKESTKKDFYTVDIPAENAAEKAYVLTATITDAEGATATVEVNKTLPVYKNVEGATTTLVEGTAYKFFFDQKSVGKVLFLLAEATNADNKFIKTTIDPKAAPDFYVEAIDGGYKFYTDVNGTKTYLRAATTKSDDGKISKYLGFDTTGTVFKYNDSYDAWYTTIDGINYVMGTYGTYETASLSEDSYYKTEDKRATQYALTVITKEAAEAMKPTEGPADPTELTSIVDILAIATAKDNGAYTVEKYLVKGLVTEIKSEQYGNLYIADENGNTIYVYGLYSKDGTNRFDVMETKPVAGDTITIMGIVGKYNDEPQFKNAWLMEIETCDHAFDNVCDDTCAKCGFVREVAHDLEDVAAVAATCTVAGKTAGVQCSQCDYKTWESIPVIAHDYYLTEKNDDVHHEICKVCSAVKADSEAAHAMGTNNVCACGFGCTHETTTWNVVTAATCTAEGVKEQTCTDCGKFISRETIAKAAHTLTNNAAVAAGCTTDGAEAYSVCSVCNAMFNAAGETIDAVVTIPATGHNYANGVCTVCGAAQSTTPPAESTVTELDMMGTTNLTSRTPDKTIYSANGITYTNDKASSTNDNYDQQGTYAARAYKSSTIKIEYTGMTRIDFVLDDYQNGQYLTGFDGMEVAGATITRNGDTVSITFAAATNVFQSAELGAQIRIEKIIVYTGEVVDNGGNGGSGNTPSDPQPPVSGNTPTALTELKNGDVVVIAAPAYNMALSMTKVATYYNAGIDITGGISGLTNDEKFTVTVNGDGSYTFTSLSGKVLALADSYSSLNDTGVNSSWALEAKAGATGVFYLKNTVRGNYLEWYAEKNNWSTYGASTLSDLFEISFYKVG